MRNENGRYHRSNIGQLFNKFTPRLIRIILILLIYLRIISVKFRVHYDSPMPFREMILESLILSCLRQILYNVFYDIGIDNFRF